MKHGDISVLASNSDGWYKAGERRKPGRSLTATSTAKMTELKRREPVRVSVP